MPVCNDWLHIWDVGSSAQASPPLRCVNMEPYRVKCSAAALINLDYIDSQNEEVQTLIIC